MVTRKMVSGAALVLSMSTAIRLDGAQGGGVTRTGGEDAGREAYLAGQRARDSDARKRLFASGIQAARTRLAVDGQDPEGLLWLAANLGGEALERGKLLALRVLPEMERLLLTLEGSAPEHDHAAAARTLGRLYHKAPGIISIGSMKKARLYWERALARAGDYPPNQVLAADFYYDDGDRPRAVGLARRYLQNPISEQDHPEAPEWRQIAERIVRRGGDR